MTSSPIILSVAFPFAPVGPAAVGGAEVILSQLEAALPGHGFRSLVVAHAASQPSGQLYPVPIPTGEIDDAVRASAQRAVQAAIDRALAEYPVALVHMHGLDFDHYTLPPALPVLVTLHLPLAWYSESIWQLPPNYSFVCVSEAQRRTASPENQQRIIVVENGCPSPDASTLRKSGRYALMLARICPEKNVATALDAARLAGMPAVLAGEVFPYPAHLRYFAEEIQPRLTQQGTSHTSHDHAAAPEARFLGSVTGAAKSRLLARAACLLLPSLAPETSSLVAMEALAAGVPVIAMASGAVPDIVEEGRTGFLIPPGSGPADAERMAAAMRRLPELNRDTCRRRAVERFSLDRMFDRYAALWRRLALVSPLLRTPPSPPVSESQGHEQVDEDDQGIYVEPLTDDAALEALLPRWTELWREDGRASPFQHPAWLLPWWHQFGPDGQLQAVALRDRVTHRLQGFYPLYSYAPSLESGSSRQLLLMGAGTSDYLDGVVAPAASKAPTLALEFASSELKAGHTGFLAQIATSSPLLGAATTLGLPIVAAEPVSIIDLARELPAKLRANAGRYRRRAEIAGSLGLGVAGNAREALASFDLLLAFHGIRWSAGETSVLADPRVQAHHREATPLLLQAGLLRFFRLTLADQTIGVLYALADPEGRPNRRLSLYLIGFETSLSALSPGTLLLHAVWTYARENGFKILDLLRGGEAYKQLWGAVEEQTFGIALVRR